MKNLLAKKIMGTIPPGAVGSPTYWYHEWNSCVIRQLLICPTVSQNSK